MKEMKRLRREYRKTKRDVELWGPVIGICVLLVFLVALVALIVSLAQQWWFWVMVGIVALSVISWKWPEKNT